MLFLLMFTLLKHLYASFGTSHSKVFKSFQSRTLAASIQILFRVCILGKCCAAISFLIRVVHLGTLQAFYNMHKSCSDI